MTALHDLGLHDLSRLIASRHASSVEVTEALIARCDAMQSTAAMITPTFDTALDTARKRDVELARGVSHGPLHGIPLGLKDAFAVRDVPTTLCGRFTPQRDAAVWHGLAAAGAVMLGKLHCAEYCLGAPGAQDMLPFARNPYDSHRSPGASSSGSAVALAVGMVPGAMGTDTGGSIRIPAAFCGVTGLKPTGGLLNTQGFFPLAPSLDQAGPMARDSRDCALLMDALVPRDDAASFADALTDRLDGLTIGYVPLFGQEARVSNEQRAAVTAALEIMKSLGAVLREVSMPPLQEFTDCFLPLMLSQAYALHTKALAEDTMMSENTRIRLEGGVQVSEAQAEHAKAERIRLCGACEQVWSQLDALVFEVVPDDAPLIGTMHPLDYLNAPMLAVPANLLNMPSLAIRCGTSAKGLPMGLQILAPRLKDSTALRIGHAYERATGHTGKPMEPVQ